MAEDHGPSVGQRVYSAEIVDAGHPRGTAKALAENPPAVAGCLLCDTGRPEPARGGLSSIEPGSPPSAGPPDARTDGRSGKPDAFRARTVGCWPQETQLPSGGASWTTSRTSSTPEPDAGPAHGEAARARQRHRQLARGRGARTPAGGVPVLLRDAAAPAGGPPDAAGSGRAPAFPAGSTWGTRSGPSGCACAASSRRWRAGSRRGVLDPQARSALRRELYLLHAVAGVYLARLRALYLPLLLTRLDADSERVLVRAAPARLPLAPAVLGVSRRTTSRPRVIVGGAGRCSPAPRPLDRVGCPRCRCRGPDLRWARGRGARRCGRQRRDSR